jgi:hypothetical protein
VLGLAIRRLGSHWGEEKGKLSGYRVGSGEI